MRFFLFLIMILLSFENLSSTEEDSDTLTLKGNFNGDCYYDLLFLKKDSSFWVPDYIVWRTSLIDTICSSVYDTNYLNARKDTTWFNFGNQRIITLNLFFADYNLDTLPDMFLYIKVKTADTINTYILSLFSQFFLDTLSVLDLTDLDNLNDKPFQFYRFLFGNNLVNPTPFGSAGAMYEIRPVHITVARKSVVNDIKKDEVILYPNPCNDKITIDLTNCKEELSWIKVYNNESKLVLNNKANNIEGRIININTLELSSGTYSLKVMYKNNTSQILSFIVIH